VAGNGAAALGHYNTDVLAGVTPPEVSERTEVWLDLAVDDGAATATASVPFVPLPGARSVVVHALATDSHTGTAGARLACLPVVW
jgi:Cu-Zn family superoxide dismutase